MAINRPNADETLTNTIQGLLINGMDTLAFRGLYRYYMEKTHEYGKALEVINHALSVCNEEDRLMEMFDKRHELLMNIIEENFWQRL